MNNELTKRIFTSLVLLPVLIYCSFYSGFYLISFLSFFYFFAFYEIIKNTKKKLFIILTNMLLISAFFSFYHLRGETYYSLSILYWTLFTTFLSDIGGYIFGRVSKGKKLTKISPSKTYSGSIGSIIFSCISLPVMNLFQQYAFNEILINFYQLKFFIFTILISVVCQVGDLYVSFWKRKIKIKNISNILPGHGGLLDRIDGLIFVLLFIVTSKEIGLL